MHFFPKTDLLFSTMTAKIHARSLMHVFYRPHPCLGTLVYGARKEYDISLDCLLFVLIAPKYYPH